MTKNHFVCPECGHKEISTKEVRPTPQYVRRRRQCAACGHRFTTFESQVRPAVCKVMGRLGSKNSWDWRTSTGEARARFTGKLSDGRLCLHCGGVFWVKIYPSQAHHDFEYCSAACQHTAEKACARSTINLPEALFMKESGIPVTVIAQKFEVSPRLMREVLQEVRVSVELSTKQQKNVS